MVLAPFIIISLMSCKNEKNAVIRVDGIFEKENIDKFELYKQKLDGAIPEDTIYANICDEPINGEELVDVILAGAEEEIKENKATKKIEVQKRIIPCNGQVLYIGNYRAVSLVRLKDSEELKIIGTSFHDSAKIGYDYILAKISDKKYAYNNGHICGSIQIQYTKDTIGVNEFLAAPIWDSAWHIITVDENN